METGFCHILGFADIIDKALGGASVEHNVSRGQLVTTMVLNGLGFTGSTLHMYSEYFKDNNQSGKPVYMTPASGNSNDMKEFK